VDDIIDDIVDDIIDDPTLTEVTENDIIEEIVDDIIYRHRISTMTPTHTYTPTLTLAPKATPFYLRIVPPAQKERSHVKIPTN